MSMSLSYRTAGPVDARVRSAILGEAELWRENHDWWCEAILFLPQRWTPGDEDKLVGDTKLCFPMGYSTVPGQVIEVDGDDDEYMARRDAAFILGRLCAWSGAHGITWVLEMGGEDFGTVAGGELSDETVAAFRDQLGWDIQAPADEYRAAQISAKYASRNSGGGRPG